MLAALQKQTDKVFGAVWGNELFACLPLLGFRTSKKWYDWPFLTNFNPKKGHLEFSGAFFLADIFAKLSFDPFNFRITGHSARKSEQMKNF